MKKIYSLLLTLLATLTYSVAQSKTEPLKILMIGAHPDDCEIRGSGLAALYVASGHDVKFISVTNGDAGHHLLGGAPLAQLRLKETQEVAKRLGVTYEVLPNHDGQLMPTIENRMTIIRKIREWKADVVITHRTNDYHPDHRYTAILVQDAAYMVGVPNIASDTPPLSKNPVFLYFQDRFAKPNPFSPDIVVDITSVMDKKIDALDAHVSQVYEWLPWIGGYADQVPTNSADKKKWLRNSNWFKIAPAVHLGLEKQYGKDKAKTIQFAEAFEISEYGSLPSETEMKRLFPMLVK